MAHIAAVSRSCRFTLYNIWKIRRYLSEHSTQLLVQALVLSSWTTTTRFSPVCMRNSPSPEDSERSSPSGLQPTQELPCYPAPYPPSLAAHHGPYHIQDPGTELPSGERDCTCQEKAKDALVPGVQRYLRKICWIQFSPGTQWHLLRDLLHLLVSFNWFNYLYSL